MAQDAEKQPKPIRIRRNSKKVSPECISAEGSLKVDDLSLARLLRYDAEGRASRSEIRNLQMNLIAYKKQVDPEGVINKLQNDISAQEQRLQKYKTEYNSLKEALSRKLGLDFNKVSYDDETGVIYETPEAD